MRPASRLINFALRCLPVVFMLMPASNLAGIAKAEREETIVIVTSTGVAAYHEVVECLKRNLNQAGVSVTSFETPGSSPDDVRAFVEATHPSVVIAVGSGAAQIASGMPASIVTTMTLLENNNERPIPPRQSLPVAQIALDLPPDRLVREINQLFPSKKRIAVVGANDLSSRSSIMKAAVSLDLTIHFVESRTPRELLAALGEVSRQADLLWCLPARDLYEPASVTALLLRSIQNRLPVIGFSEGFARAGAAASFFPDYRDVGMQTSEAVRRYLEGGSESSRERPRRFRVCVNRRVIRILGIKMPDSANLEVIR